MAVEEVEGAEADSDLEGLSALDSEAQTQVYSPTKNLDRRIDQYLSDRIPWLSRTAIKRLIEEGGVRVNGKPSKPSYHPRDKDRIEVDAPPKPVSELVPENIPLEIVFEDDDFLALNKQAGLMVHPARGVWTGTLVNGLVFYGNKWSTVGGSWRPGILHRLDRNTTGIMLVAKSETAHWRLARQFANRTIQKTYVAICHGIPELAGGVIDLPIGRDRYVRERQSIRKEENGGRAAVTMYEVLESFTRPGVVPPEAPHAGKFSLLRLTPKTGRTHQLRVHMAAKGFPLVGDDMYGGKPAALPEGPFIRQALHAAEISFIHPATLAPMTLGAPLPKDLQSLLGFLRGTGSGELIMKAATLPAGKFPAATWSKRRQK